MLRAALFLCLAALAAAQSQQPAVVSPDVHPDRTVTFRVRAPKASEVAFTADWMLPAGASVKMTRGDGGVWSYTSAPLAPNVYIYAFIVDGVTVADPVNPRIKLRSRTSASMVEVTAADASAWDPRNVPHGSVTIEWQHSPVLGGEQRAMWIYTPPGYTKETSRRYPVLYLFHGSNDIAGGWTLAGHANFILDNLIAAKKATPMIVVMPYGHAVPFGSPREVQAKNNPLFEDYVIKEVLPFVEGKYRVAAGAANRAIAGLSMGGGHSLLIGMNHLDRFSAIGAFSAAVPGDFDTRFKTQLADAAATNAKLKLFWIGCGKDDFLFERNTKFDALLTQHKIKHTFRPTAGAHTYSVWREYLTEFAPLLFQGK